MTHARVDRAYPRSLNRCVRDATCARSSGVHPFIFNHCDAQRVGVPSRDSLFDLWEDEIPPVLSVNIGQSGYLRS